MYIYSHNPLSLGAKQLAHALGAKRIKHEGSRFRGRYNKVVVNWGASVVPEQVGRCTIINHLLAVANAINKKKCFQILDQSGVSVPEWTDSKCTAMEWIEGSEDIETVICRTLLSSTGGNGIVLASTEDEVVDAPLYTLYKKKQHEYRVHVHMINGPYYNTYEAKVFDIQKKARRLSVPNESVNWQVRNHANGFVYSRNNINTNNVPDVVVRQAKAAVGFLELHFGAVDVIYNEHDDKAYVLEVNTAPGLEGQTVNSYVEMLRHYDV